MSDKQSHRAWELPESIRGAEFIIALALADQAGDDGICWPSDETLAAKARIDERTVRRCIRSLEERGFLETRPMLGLPSVFILHLPDPVRRRRPKPRRLRPDDPRRLFQPAANPGHDVRGSPGGTPDTMSGVTPDILSANPGHPVREPRTSCPRTPDILSTPIKEPNSEPYSEPYSEPSLGFGKKRTGHVSDSIRAGDALAGAAGVTDGAGKLLGALVRRLAVDGAGRTRQARSDLTCLRRCVTEWALGRFGPADQARATLLRMATEVAEARNPRAAFQARLKELREERETRKEG